MRWVSILFHWSMFLFLCQYYIVLMAATLQYSLKSGRLIPPAPFVFVKIALAIWCPLCFHTICEVVFFFFLLYIYEKYHRQFDKGFIESVDCFMQYCHFHNIDSSVQEHDICVICLFHLRFLSSVSYSFLHIPFFPFRQVDSQVFYFFLAMVNGILSLIARSDFLFLVYRNEAQHHSLSEKCKSKPL